MHKKFKLLRVWRVFLFESTLEVSYQIHRIEKLTFVCVPKSYV